MFGRRGHELPPTTSALQFLLSTICLSNYFATGAFVGVTASNDGFQCLLSLTC